MADYKHVVIIGADGSGPYFKDADAPNLKRIFENGVLVHNMRANSFTSSAPSWTSFLHGVWSEHHGIVENWKVESDLHFAKDKSRYPSFLKVVKDAFPNEEVAAHVAWIGIRGMLEEDSGVNYNHIYDIRCTEFLTKTDYLETTRPKLLYVLFGAPDGAGHSQGYGSEYYMNVLHEVDGRIGAIYDKLAEVGMIEDTLFMIVADHGGKGKRHGGLSYEEKNTIFAAAGKTVVKGGQPEGLEFRDIGAIVLHALGVKRPETYTARIPGGLFIDTPAEERIVRYDPENPRYHVPTETRDLPAFARERISKELTHYFPLDSMDEGLEVHGDVRMVDGYHGKGINVDDGHLFLRGFDPGTDSFSISMWVKTPACYLDAPFIGNKLLEDFEECEQNGMTDFTDGFILSSFRNTYRRPVAHSAKLDIVVGGEPFSLTADLPDDFVYGWVHITLVINRESGEASIYYDFKRCESAKVPNLDKPYSLTEKGRTLGIGQDATGEYRFKFGLSVDEFAIFKGALTEDDISALGEYYKD